MVKASFAAIACVTTVATLFACKHTTPSGAGGGGGASAGGASTTGVSVTTGGNPDAGVVCFMSPPTCTPPSTSASTGAGGAGGATTAASSGAGGGPMDAGSDAPLDTVPCDPFDSAAYCTAPGEACDWSAEKKEFLCYPGPNNVAGSCSMCDEIMGPYCSPGFTCLGITKCAAFCCSDADCSAGSSTAKCKPISGATFHGASVGICLEP